MYAKTSAGVGRAPLIDGDRKLVTVPGGGKLAEASLAGRLFTGTNSALVNTSVTLETTFIGLGLTNPTGSGKNLIVHKFSYAISAVITAEAMLCLATTTDSGMTVTEFTPYCTRYGYATSVAKVRDGGTIVAPVILMPIASLGDSATTTWLAIPKVVNLDGSIVLAPGRSLVTDTTVAIGTAVARFAYMWEEVDV